MSNKNQFLKDAIADANIIKEVAMNNAKQSIEEAFAPYVAHMLETKIQEMEDENQVNESENIDENEDLFEEDFNLDELLREMSEEENLSEAKGDEKEEEDEEDPEIDLENLSEEDLKSFIEEVIQDMVENGELEANEDEDSVVGDDDMDFNLEDEDDGESEEDLNETESLTQQLQESIKTIKSLRSELNETRLLNSKLLYVNKLYKSKNLSESSKTKILEAFDRAGNTKEAKMTYELLKENISTVKTKPSNRAVKGLASRVASNVLTEGKQPKNTIIENDMVRRFQELAGIK